MEGSEDGFTRMSRGHPCIQEPKHPATRGTVPPSNSRRSPESWRPSVFDFRSGRRCPTCHGTGRIPHGQDDELVALIPYSDKRLKPRKRYCVRLSVLLVVLLIVLLVCGSVLLAFMFPRSASLSLVAMNSSTEWDPIFPNGTYLNITMETTVHINNRNFFPLHVHWLRIDLYNINTHVGTIVNPSFSVTARQATAAVVDQNATFSGSLADRVWTLCTGNGWSHCLNMLAEAEMQYSVLSHTAETVTSKYFFVSCDFFEGSTSDWTDSSVCS